MLAITWVLTYIAVPIAGVDLRPGRLAAAWSALWPFCLLFGTFSLFLSALVRRAFLATVIPAVILVAMYVIESLAQVDQDRWSRPAWSRSSTIWASPSRATSPGWPRC